MKQKILIALILIMSGFQIKAQHTGMYFGGGYNMSSYTNAPLLNSILSEYNSTRPWLTTKMDNNMNSMTGLCFNTGIYIGHFFMDLDWVGRNKETYGEGISPSTGLMVRRDLKIRSNTFNSGLGYLVIPYLGFGTSIDFGSVKCLTRVYKSSDTPPDYTKVAFTDLTCGVSLFALVRIPVSKNGILHIDIKPYYQLMIVRSNYGYLHDELNGSNIFYEDPGDLRNNFGFEIKLQVGFGNE